MTTASVHPPSSPAPRRARVPAAEEAEPISVAVPAAARFEGLLTFRGRALVDGEVEGEIVCRGTLELGENARVIATVEVDELIVAGTLEGDVTARERVELKSTARVKGIIRAPRVALEDGCLLEGRCETAPPRQDPGPPGEITQ